MSLLPGTNIRVDNFEFMKNDLMEYTFFLSHCHEDHIMGLNSAWNYGRIYTSQTSANIILDRFPNLKPLVIPLELDEEHWIYLDEKR
jgi:mRNA degradation ribonuclease J1/J2